MTGQGGLTLQPNKPSLRPSNPQIYRARPSSVNYFPRSFLQIIEIKEPVLPLLKLQGHTPNRHFLSVSL